MMDDSFDCAKDQFQLHWHYACVVVVHHQTGVGRKIPHKQFVCHVHIQYALYVVVVVLYLVVSEHMLIVFHCYSMRNKSKSLRIDHHLKRVIRYMQQLSIVCTPAYAAVH